MPRDNIIVTGFGPFGEHLINASWESVRLLPSEIDGYKVIKEEVPVSYDSVDKRIHALWKEYNPELVIHVGVSSFTDKITLETCAYKVGYNQKDCFGNCPVRNNECLADCSENCLQVGIEVNDICNHLNQSEIIKACVSQNAGRYLCEYIFYTSLSIDQNRTMFIHVPPLGKPYNDQEIAAGILEVIHCALKQIKSA